MSSDQPLFYSDYNHLGNDPGAAEHTCSACANQRPGGSKPSESISLTLRRRLLKFALDAGARRAWLDLSGAQAVLRVQDGRGQSFNVEIDGLQRAWLEAIEQLAHDACVEPETAGLLRYVRATGSKRLKIAHAQPIRFGDQRIHQPSSGYTNTRSAARSAERRQWQATNKEMSKDRAKSSRTPRYAGERINPANSR
jgi:hypothetical protein